MNDLLKKILQVMLHENIIRKPELAKSIGVQLETLEDMLKMLLDRGLLRLGDCVEITGNNCAGCPSAEGCQPDDTSGKYYYVTEKGKKYASS
jgi:predicted transcriptional regulator